MGFGSGVHTRTLVRLLLVRLPLCFLAGALVSVGLAWAAAIGWPKLGKPSTPAMRWPAGAPAAWPDLPDWGAAYRGLGIVVARRTAFVIRSSATGRFDKFDSTAPPKASVWVLEATTCSFGWPSPCLSYQFWEEGTASASSWAAGTPQDWRAGLGIPWLERHAQGYGSVLPLRPLRSGLLADASLFGGILALLWLPPAVLRIAFRSRCGLCPRCGYPRAAPSVCTECGVRVKPLPDGPRPPRPWSPRARRRLIRACIVCSVFTVALIAATAPIGLSYTSGNGLYLALWRDQVIISRYNRLFEHPGFALERVFEPFRLLPHWSNSELGWRLALPMWPPLTAVGAVGAAVWWRSAVRRGIARHWPVAAPTSRG